VRSRLVLAVVLIAAAAQPCAAQQPSSSEVTEFTLPNGLHVMLRPVQNAELTTVMTLYDIGELHEPEGRSGIAHLTEHLLVTAATDEDEAMSADAWFAQYDMNANAQTGPEYTVIATSTPSVELELELARTAARLSALKITDEDVKREKPRALMELKYMYEGPPALAARNIARQHVDPSPKGARRGGLTSTIEALTADDLRDWYSRYYRVNNATLIVVGRFNLESTTDQINNYFGGLSPGDEAPPRRSPAPIEPGKGAIVNVAAAHAGSGPSRVVTLAFAAPTPATDEWAAFLLVAPRIYQQVLSSGAQMNPAAPPFVYTPLDDPGGLYITRPLNPGEDADIAIEGLWESVRAACTFDPAAPVDRSMFQYEYGPMLHVVRVPDQMIGMHTYGEALRIGRFRQLGLTPEGLRDQILDTTADSMTTSAAALFSPERSFSVEVIAE
jgi:zinc protease